MTSSASESLFHGALERPAPDRERYVFERCRRNWRLYQEILELLRFHEDPESLFSRPLVNEGELKSALHDHFLSNFPPGTEIRASTGTYRIHELAGEGGMGFVYRAEQTRPLSRTVAFKIIKLALNGHRITERFESERRVLALMNHPHVARVFEAGTTEEGHPFFTMEFVPGLPITEFCDGRGLTITERIQLMIRVLKGVQHAHLKGIVHRDIKPSNILVEADADGEFIPKIIDFGVAKAVDHRLVEHSIHTRTGVVVGTMRYISPEQIDPRIPDFDTRSDIYSLGVVLYELLVGGHPLGLDSTGLGHAEMEHRIVDMAPVPPRARLRDLDLSVTARNRSTTSARLRRHLGQPELGWILSRCLEKDRSQRYVSAADVAGDLGRLLSHEPLLYGPPSSTYKLRRMLRRHWRGLTSIALVLGTLAVGLAQSTRLYLQNKHAERESRMQLATVLRLSDAKQLENLMTAVHTLVPTRPDGILAMETWLREAEDVLSRLPLHRATLNGLNVEPTAAGTLAQTAFQVRILTDLVGNLEKFGGPGGRGGVVAAVRNRLEFGRRVRHDTIEAQAQAWEWAMAAIADTVQSPAYHGMKLAPQLGLVPLGPDTATGLWEFGHLQTGEPAPKTPTGSLEVSEETGLVMVLIPGGSFYMGATSASLDVPAQVGDPRAAPAEEPPHRVTLDPFFISKYEMTQAQWLRVFAENPSEFPREEPCTGVWRPLLHPVENVDWNLVSRGMDVLGLALPTEAQWEYAARGGTTSPWWTGWDPLVMGQNGNFVDNCNFMLGPGVANPDLVNDGYGESSPVGSFAANPFGLHDVLGNVFEWCRDYFGSYRDPVTPGTGLRLGVETEDRVFRGGVFTLAPHLCRVSRRFGLVPETRVRIGVRPARPVEVMNHPASATATSETPCTPGAPPP